MAEDRLILLVEDDVLIGMMLVDMFDALGYPEPAQATTNEEALAGIPFAFTSGGGDVIPAPHANRKLVTKPFRIAEIEAVLNGFFAE